MFERILSKAQTVAAQRRSAQIERLADTMPPPGITIMRADEGVALSGKRLRHRLVTDAALRNFGK